MRPTCRSLPALLATALLLAACRGGPPPTRTAAAPSRTRAPAPAACAPAPSRALRQAPPAAGPGFTRSDVPFEQVLQEAGRRGRPALLYFCASWCGWCDRMNRTTLTRPEVGARLRDFVAVRYDPDTPTGRALASRFGARGFPTVVVVDAQGTVLKEMVGYREAPDFLDQLRGL